jgi:hypothetical protein
VFVSLGEDPFAVADTSRMAANGISPKEGLVRPVPGEKGGVQYELGSAWGHGKWMIIAV